MRRGPMRRRDESGAVTAEAAVVIPLVALVAVALAWLVGLGVAQVRVLDAAREVARAVARGDSEASGKALGRRVAPDGARFEVSSDDGTVVVGVSAPVRGLGGVFAFLPSYDVDAEAVALLEERSP